MTHGFGIDSVGTAQLQGYFEKEKWHSQRGP